MIAHRIRLEVTDQQARTLERWCEAARLAWNWGVSERDRQHRDRVGGPAFARRRGRWIPVGPQWQPDPDAPREDLDRLTTRVRRKAGLWWMVEPPARVYRTEFRTLDEAWRRCRDGLSRRPVPKRRATSFGLSNQDVRLDGHRVRLPKIGWLRLTERLRWRGTVKTVRVSCRGGPVVLGRRRRLGPPARPGCRRQRRPRRRRADVGRSRVGGRPSSAAVRQSAGARCAAAPTAPCGACRLAQAGGFGEPAQGGAASGPTARAGRRGSARCDRAGVDIGCPLGPPGRYRGPVGARHATEPPDGAPVGRCGPVPTARPCRCQDG